MSELQQILKTMNIPEKRLGDFNWLLRNIGIRNAAHPKLQRAIELLKSEDKS